MSRGKNETVNAATFNMFTGQFVEFEWCYYLKIDHFMGNLGTNTIKHVSEMELYIILSTLEKFECWNLNNFSNEISVGETVVGAW